jgi:hypothetical protein
VMLIDLLRLSFRRRKGEPPQGCVSQDDRT